MSQRAVEETFNALFALTDLRFVLREAKPSFRLDEGQRRRVREALFRVRRSADLVERELLGPGAGPGPAQAEAQAGLGRPGPSPGTEPGPAPEGAPAQASTGGPEPSPRPHGAPPEGGP
jgi:hypothetical protein